MAIAATGRWDTGLMFTLDLDSTHQEDDEYADEGGGDHVILRRGVVIHPGQLRLEDVDRGNLHSQLLLELVCAKLKDSCISEWQGEEMPADAGSCLMAEKLLIRFLRFCAASGDLSKMKVRHTGAHLSLPPRTDPHQGYRRDELAQPVEERRVDSRPRAEAQQLRNLRHTHWHLGQ